MWTTVVTKIGISMKTFSKSVPGEEHIIDHKPCQDHSVSEDVESVLSVAIVSDGHGGKPYFRSHIGSEKACSVAMNAIKEFVNSADASSFAIDGKDAAQIPALTAVEHHVKRIGGAEEQLRQLSKTIIMNWRKEVEDNAVSNKLSEWEKDNVAQEYLEQLKNNDKLFRIYGCTIMAFVVTPTYWFAMHLGDGKCFAFYDKKSGKVWDEPIPWDKRCFLNKTTSLCASDAYESFRFAYGGVDSMPLAVFLGSDGLDDTFSDNDLLCDFYIKILKEILFSSQEKVESELEESLSVLSSRGSHDDMSVACLYDEARLKDNIGYIHGHQISLVSSRIDNSEKHFKDLITRKQDLEHYLDVKKNCFNWNKNKEELENKLGISSNTNIEIEMGFVEKDIIREKRREEQLLLKKRSLESECAKIDEISRTGECGAIEVIGKAEIIANKIETQGVQETNSEGRVLEK